MGSGAVYESTFILQGLNMPRCEGEDATKRSRFAGTIQWSVIQITFISAHEPMFGQECGVVDLDFVAADCRGSRYKRFMSLFEPPPRPPGRQISFQMTVSNPENSFEQLMLHVTLYADKDHHGPLLQSAIDLGLWIPQNDSRSIIAY